MIAQKGKENKMEKNKRIIEINGIKMEVDMITAKRNDEFKVGDNIKVLRKGYNDSYDVMPGVIVQFVNFKDLPTIQIAVFKSDYSGAHLEFINFNSKTEDVEITLCSNHELRLEKNSVMDKLNNEIQKKQNEAADLIAKRDWFEKYFAKYFDGETAQ
jgi:preprotein translocase subunit YajC